jgi:hypothetical protein
MGRGGCLRTGRQLDENEVSLQGRRARLVSRSGQTTAATTCFRIMRVLVGLREFLMSLIIPFAIHVLDSALRHDV